MKKTAVFIMLSVMLVFCLAGCGGREKYAGKWEAKEMKVNNSTITDIANIPLNVIMRFELNSSGSAKWASPLESVKDPSKDGITASWKIKDEKIIMTVNYKDDKKTIEFTDIDGKLAVEQGASILYLEKVDEFSPVDTQALQNLFSNFDISSIMGG